MTKVILWTVIFFPIGGTSARVSVQGNFNAFIECLLAFNGQWGVRFLDFLF